MPFSLSINLPKRTTPKEPNVTRSRLTMGMHDAGKYTSPCACGPNGQSSPVTAMATAAVPPAAAPRCLYPGKDHRAAITVPEFKRWLKQFDTDNDGRISRKELREAIRRRGAWFSGLRSRFAIWRADRNHDGFVDDSEIDGLIEFAATELGFKITTDAHAQAPAAAAGGPHLAGRVTGGASPAANPPVRSTTYMAYANYYM
ncbi:hypothetical protein HU200_046045 [Digitaria exilis]|uniref:EF-hand domain-containing protein n=1 Tax=Digitaria exilis TaxID=1010633 RepID=A0A835BAH0_9POAL|nr:hypothetical protein HU200_046045 [Digitaria exilis]